MACYYFWCHSFNLSLFLVLEVRFQLAGTLVSSLGHLVPESSGVKKRDRGSLTPIWGLRGDEYTTMHLTFFNLRFAGAGGREE